MEPEHNTSSNWSSPLVPSMSLHRVIDARKGLPPFIRRSRQAFQRYSFDEVQIEDDLQLERLWHSRRCSDSSIPFAAGCTDGPTVQVYTHPFPSSAQEVRSKNVFSGGLPSPQKHHSPRGQSYASPRDKSPRHLPSGKSSTGLEESGQWDIQLPTLTQMDLGSSATALVEGAGHVEPTAFMKLHQRALAELDAIESDDEGTWQLSVNVSPAPPDLVSIMRLAKEPADETPEDEGPASRRSEVGSPGEAGSPQKEAVKFAECSPPAVICYDPLDKPAMLLKKGHRRQAYGQGLSNVKPTKLARPLPKKARLWAQDFPGTIAAALPPEILAKAIFTGLALGDNRVAIGMPLDDPSVSTEGEAPSPRSSAPATGAQRHPPSNATAANQGSIVPAKLEVVAETPQTVIATSELETRRPANYSSEISVSTPPRIEAEPTLNSPAEERQHAAQPGASAPPVRQSSARTSTPIPQYSASPTSTSPRNAQAPSLHERASQITSLRLEGHSPAGPYQIRSSSTAVNAMRKEQDSSRSIPKPSNEPKESEESSWAIATWKLQPQTSDFVAAGAPNQPDVRPSFLGDPPRVGLSRGVVPWNGQAKGGGAAGPNPRSLPGAIQPATGTVSHYSISRTGQRSSVASSSPGSVSSMSLRLASPLSEQNFGLFAQRHQSVTPSIMSYDSHPQNPLVWGTSLARFANPPLRSASCAPSSPPSAVKESRRDPRRAEIARRRGSATRGLKKTGSSNSEPPAAGWTDPPLKQPTTASSIHHPKKSRRRRHDQGSYTNTGRRLKSDSDRKAAGFVPPNLYHAGNPEQEKTHRSVNSSPLSPAHPELKVGSLKNHAQANQSGSGFPPDPHTGRRRNASPAQWSPRNASILRQASSASTATSVPWQNVLFRNGDPLLRSKLVTQSDLGAMQAGQSNTAAFQNEPISYSQTVNTNLINSGTVETRKPSPRGARRSGNKNHARLGAAVWRPGDEPISPLSRVRNALAALRLA